MTGKGFAAFNRIIILASTQQNLSSGFPIKRDSNQSPQQRLAKKKEEILLVASLDILSNKRITKVLISELLCAFVEMQIQSTDFLR